MKKECFSELIDHGHGKYTLFGRVLADTPDDPGRQNVRSANIAIPPDLEIGHYVVSATASTMAMPAPSPSWHRDGGTMRTQADMSANISSWRPRKFERGEQPRPRAPEETMLTSRLPSP